jgi:hypothetical protein
MRQQALWFVVARWCPGLPHRYYSTHKFLTSFFSYFIFCFLYIVSCGRISYFGRTHYAQLQGDMSGMRLFDISFYHSVRLPEGATGIQRSRHLLEGLLPEDEIRSQEKQTRKEISSAKQGNLRDEGTAAVALWATARAKEVSSLPGRSSKSEA